MYFLLVETRGSKILEDRAQKLTKQTGILHISETDIHKGAGEEMGLWQKVIATASRPIVYLITEPVVTAMSLWAALL